MKAMARLKFLIGILFVVMLCASLFVYLDYSMSRVDSLDARLSSDSYTVGLDYSSIVQKQFVEEGGYVKVNDPLFEVRSSTLAEAIRNNEVAQSSLLYKLTEKGNVLISAAANGRVQEIKYRQGSFVPANSEIAVINNENGLYVSATYKLSSPDYARINTRSKLTVILPDNTTLQGSVYNITLETVDKEVLTTVRARIDQEAVNQVAFSIGTPVRTTMLLDTNTWYDQITNVFKSLFHPTSR
jgi:multidrug resistance efflux pump